MPDKDESIARLSAVFFTFQVLHQSVLLWSLSNIPAIALFRLTILILIGAIGPSRLLGSRGIY